MSGSRKLSFIITARNEPPAILQATIEGLLRTSTDWERELFVVDDGSATPLCVQDPEVTLLRNEPSMGNSRSRRLGASQSKGDVLVWLDAHMSFAPGWLEAMLEHVDSGAVLCSAFWNYERAKCHGYGADFAWRGDRDGAQRYPGFTVRHRARLPGPGAVPVPMVIGGCYMMLRRTYRQLGGFSPLARVCGGSEQDLSARAWMAGVEVRCVTGACVGHLWRPRFPYAIDFAQLEFNQLALVRTIFEDATVRALEKCFQPVSGRIRDWFEEDAAAMREWRGVVQAARKWSDGEFFKRFVPELAGISRPSRRISFVVVTRDEAPAVLEETIDGLLSTSADQDREVVVVDDGSLIPVSVERPVTSVIRNEKAVGVAQSRRLGAAAATGEVLVWLDAHMRFAPDWLERMLAHVDSGALLCAAWWDYELTRPLCFGAEFVWCGERDYKAGRTPGLNFRHITKSPGPGAVVVPMVIGACYMMRRDSYDHCGGFSPFFRIWGKSEQDLSARAWITGLQVKCVTGARVGHLSRSRFPYPVTWSDIEFNQAISFRALLEDATLPCVEDLLRPLPADAARWLAEVDAREWRRGIQLRRCMSDAEFFRRFVPNAPDCLKAEATAAATTFAPSKSRELPES